MKLGWYQERSERVRRRENVIAVVIIIFGSSVGIEIAVIAK
jgi:type IV secretory pathway component VirB8